MSASPIEVWRPAAPPTALRCGGLGRSGWRPVLFGPWVISPSSPTSGCCPVRGWVTSRSPLRGSHLHSSACLSRDPWAPLSFTGFPTLVVTFVRKAASVVTAGWPDRRLPAPGNVERIAGRVNRLPNSQFETGTAGWSVVGGHATMAPTDPADRRGHAGLSARPASPATSSGQHLPRHHRCLAITPSTAERPGPVALLRLSTTRRQVHVSSGHSAGGSTQPTRRCAALPAAKRGQPGRRQRMGRSPLLTDCSRDGAVAAGMSRGRAQSRW